VGTDADWVSVSGGYSHAVALKANGSLWVWGYNVYGQLGTGNTTNRDLPYRMDQATDWQAVTCGQYHTMAIKKDGSLWAWGGNAGGQLVVGEPGSKLLPTREYWGENDYVTVAGGREHSLTITEAGDLYSCGSNLMGQLGVGEPLYVGWTAFVYVDGGFRASSDY
jgi:alpha-tubulin suppressor-like RCC1 family protein